MVRAADVTFRIVLLIGALAIVSMAGSDALY